MGIFTEYYDNFITQKDVSNFLYKPETIRKLLKETQKIIDDGIKYKDEQKKYRMTEKTLSAAQQFIRNHGLEEEFNKYCDEMIDWLESTFVFGIVLCYDVKKPIQGGYRNEYRS